MFPDLGGGRKVAQRVLIATTMDKKFIILLIITTHRQSTSSQRMFRRNRVRMVRTVVRVHLVVPLVLWAERRLIQGRPVAI